MSLHEIAPRLAVARDTRHLELELGGELRRCTHRTRRCERCGGTADVYGIVMVRPPLSVSVVNQGQVTANPTEAQGPVGWCRACGLGSQELTEHPRMWLSWKAQQVGRAMGRAAALALGRATVDG